MTEYQRQSFKVFPTFGFEPWFMSWEVGPLPIELDLSNKPLTELNNTINNTINKLIPAHFHRLSPNNYSMITNSWFVAIITPHWCFPHISSPQSFHDIHFSQLRKSDKLSGQPSKEKTFGLPIHRGCQFSV